MSNGCWQCMSRGKDRSVGTRSVNESDLGLTCGALTSMTKSQAQRSTPGKCRCLWSQSGGPIPANPRGAYFDTSTKLDQATISNDQHTGRYPQGERQSHRARLVLCADAVLRTAGAQRHSIRWQSQKQRQTGPRIPGARPGIPSALGRLATARTE